MDAESEAIVKHFNERRRKKHFKEKYKKAAIIGGIVAAVLLCLILVGSHALKDAKTMKSKASQLKDSLQVSVECLKGQDYAGANTAIRQVDIIVEELQDKLGQPLWKFAAAMPFVGKDVSTINELIGLLGDASDDLMKPAITLLSEHPLSDLKLGDGFNVGLLVSYVDFAEELAPKMDTMITQIEGIDLASPILKSMDKDGKIDQYKGKLTGVIDQYNELKEYLPVFQTFLGDGNDRLYVLAAQNSSEIRACGGFPGSVGTIRIQDGVLTIGKFESVYDMFSYSTPTGAEVTDEENQLFGYWMSYPRDACYDPDFTRVGKIWALGYESQNGEAVDGVVSMTPTIIQDILALYGGITLSDGSVLDGTNATKMLQYQLYRDYFSAGVESEESNTITDELFAETAQKAMSMFTSGFDIKAFKEYIKMFTDGTENRTIMMWMADEAEEEIILDSGCSGALNTGENNAVTGVYYSGSDPCKLGWFFNLDTEVVNSVANADGTHTYDVKATFTNTIDQETIANSGGYILGSYEGTMKGFVHFFAPTGGTIENISASNGMAFSETEYQGLEVAYSLYIMIYPDAPIEITYQVTTAAGVDDPLIISSTPTLQKYR